MELMIWVVTFALFAFVLYTIRTTPPSSGCLSADAARALDERKRAAPSRRTEPQPEATPPAAAPTEPSPAVLAESPADAPTDAETAAGATVELLRNPMTGDTAAVPTNYRFAKKWIKEALVAEGLLDRVYGNNELDADISEKVRAALREFRTLTKYHA